MSAFAYVSFGIATCITILAYFLGQDSKLVLTLLPMLLVIGGIPLLMNELNRRHVDKLDLSHVRLIRIKDLVKKEIGEQVSIGGTVVTVTHKWLNQPKFHVVDQSGKIVVHMFVAPRDTIRCGDQVEVVGTLRWTFGFKKKEKKIWGLRMAKVSGSAA